MVRKCLYECSMETFIELICFGILVYHKYNGLKSVVGNITVCIIENLIRAFRILILHSVFPHIRTCVNKSHLQTINLSDVALKSQGIYIGCITTKINDQKSVLT